MSQNTRRIGIDPGISGSIVILEKDNVIDWLLMPAMKVSTATRVNGAELTSFLSKYQGVPVYLESVHSMPKQGVASSFNFGHSSGVVQGVVQGLGNPLIMVTPQSWKKAAGLIGTEKDAARSKAIMLWPHWRALDSKGKGGALADAALIAKYSN